MINYALLALLIILILLSLKYSQQIDGSKQSQCTDHSDCCNIEEILDHCKVDDLNQQQCLETEYNPCPQLNGSYDQCTNNVVPPPPSFNCPCDNRTFEMCPHKYSQKCLYHKLDNCTDCTSKTPIQGTKSRINMWKYAGEDPKDFIIQCN